MDRAIIGDSGANLKYRDESVGELDADLDRLCCGGDWSWPRGSLSRDLKWLSLR